jgi:hypothetical protein
MRSTFSGAPTGIRLEINTASVAVSTTAKQVPSSPEARAERAQGRGALRRIRHARVCAMLNSDVREKPRPRPTRTPHHR